MSVGRVEQGLLNTLREAVGTTGIGDERRYPLAFTEVQRQVLIAMLSDRIERRPPPAPGWGGAPVAPPLPAQRGTDADADDHDRPPLSVQLETFLKSGASAFQMAVTRAAAVTLLKLISVGVKPPDDHERRIKHVEGYAFDDLFDRVDKLERRPAHDQWIVDILEGLGFKRSV